MFPFLQRFQPKSKPKLQSKYNNNNKQHLGLTNEDIVFWANQFREHAKYMFELLNDREGMEFKRRAKELQQQWTQFIRYYPLSDNSLFPLLTSTVTLQRDILKKRRMRGKIGFLPIALVLHMIKEEQHIEKLLQGKLTIQDELEFWIREAAEHTELLGHMIDPVNREHQRLTRIILQIAQELDQQLQNPTDPSVPLQESDRLAQQLLAAVKAQQIFVLITPSMIEHEIRESAWSKQRIHFLQQAQAQV